MVRALVIELDPGRRAGLVELVRSGGNTAVVAAATADALAGVELEAIDVIVLDRARDVGAMATACALVRAHPAGELVPVIAISDDDDPDGLEAAIAAGADEVLARPVSVGLLALRMRAQVRTGARARAERAAAAAARRERDEQIRLAARKDALTEFLVHDLKSPLASVILALQELVALCETPLGRDAARACLATTEVVSRMVLNLLDVSSGHALPVALGPCDVAGLFRHLRDDFAPRLELRELTLATRSEAREVWADGELLRRVAENLLDNALRYAPPRTQVDVTIEASDEWAQLIVTDRGPGIPPAHRERVFDRFVQLDPDAGRRASRGLGLAFCRLALEAHHGRIWVDEPPGGGARVVAEFPGRGRRC